MKFYSEDEMQELKRKIETKEITICNMCDTLFAYKPKKVFCDDCVKQRLHDYYQRPEVKKRRREYNRRPEVIERMRVHRRNYKERQKKLRKEE